MEWELYSGNAKAIIESAGGYVTNLSDDRGDILFPKRNITNDAGEEKTRGGCHVCMPNFGPDGGTGLGQHGYGRTSEWTVVGNDATSVTLALAGQGTYADVRATLRYSLTDTDFTSTLTLRNGGTEPLAVSPGFHPYFFVGEQPAMLDGEQLHQEEYAEAKFVDGNERRLEANGRMVTITSENLNRWALWTDQLGQYFCVEPTQSGFAFAEDLGRADMLDPDAERVYTYKIAW